MPFPAVRASDASEATFAMILDLPSLLIDYEEQFRTGATSSRATDFRVIFPNILLRGRAEHSDGIQQV
jgi:hypothetical protein